MSIWKRERPDRSPEKTLGVTQSQILSTSPAQPEPPRALPEPPRRRAAPSPQEMSMWAGNVLPSDEFAPDAGRKPPRRRSRALGILVVVGGLAAGGLVWSSWPRVPFSTIDWSRLSTSSSATSVKPDPVADHARAPAPAPPAVPAPVASAPIATTPPPTAAPAGASVATASPTTSPEVAPTELPPVVKRGHSSKSIAKAKSSRRHHVKASKSSKRLHAKTTHRTAAAE